MDYYNSFLTSFLDSVLVPLQILLNTATKVILSSRIWLWLEDHLQQKLKPSDQAWWLTPAIPALWEGSLEVRSSRPAWPT